MTLQDLYDQLVSDFPLYAQKDLKTAVRILAAALQCSEPSRCPLDHAAHSLSSIYRLVETHLISQGKSPHTVRNTKNNLSRFFRLAEDKHLFTFTPAPLTPCYPTQKPGRPGVQGAWRNGTYLRYHDWPHQLQDAFTAFATWATSPIVPERDAKLRKRPWTIQSYQNTFEAFFGYLHHIRHVSPLTFEHLVDFDLVSAFVHWHVNELHHRPTEAIRNFLKNLLAFTRQYHPLPAFRAQVVALRKTLPLPPPRYNKKDAWVSLDTLNQIGLSLWPKKRPKDIISPHSQVPGLRYARRAGLSLMLRLWTFRPYRSRNMREMQLGENLHQDAQGLWRITFRGEQLKVATKRGQANIFDLPFPQDLVPLLEDYLDTWRPILLRGRTNRESPPSLEPNPYVFLTSNATPYNYQNLKQSTKDIVYRYTGKHWHPHIIRTVWATEWIKKTHGDFYTAAIMLNDRLDTVITKYTHLLEEDVAEKADRLIAERNGHAKAV
jgi:hypothetical protein